MVNKPTRRDFLALSIGAGAGAAISRLPVVGQGSRCHGNGKAHCCWIEGKVCEYLGENIVPSRRWACKLYVKHGTWPKVHESAEHRHLREVKWKGTALEGLLCGDWPQNLAGFKDGSKGSCCFSNQPEYQPT